MKVKKTDFDNLHIGHRIYTDKAHCEECVEKVKAKGFGYSIGSDFMGAYVMVEKPGFEPGMAKEGEVMLWGIVIDTKPLFISKYVDFLKEQQGFVGVSPIPRGFVALFEEENQQKIAYNLMNHRGWKVQKVGNLFVEEEFLNDNKG